MTLYLISFLSGVLTILAPCVLPVLPVILGGSVQQGSIKRAIVICVSFMISVIAFTFLLKASSALIGIEPSTWKYISGGILIAFGIVMLFPVIWEKISMRGGFHRANNLATQAKQQGGTVGNILLGAALGPIFSTCSPTYSLILAVVLPVSLAEGIINIVLYALGIGLMLFILAVGGIRIVKRVRRLANPNGWFKTILAVIILLTGLSIITGFDKKIEIAILDAGFIDVTRIEQSILDPYIQNKQEQGKSDQNSSQSDQVDQNTQGSNTNAQNISSQIKKLYNASYPAPELAGLTNRINTSGYTSLAQLRGKVVIIDFWTYSCINCIRTLPYLRQWHDRYADQGLVIIGVHAPEFQFEKDIKNVRQAVSDFGLLYPIVQDNDFQTWRAYENNYRPAKYIIDANGIVRYTHFGEGEYEETELVIQGLLQEAGMLSGSQQPSQTVIPADATGGGDRRQTAETYLGTERRAVQPYSPAAYAALNGIQNPDSYARWTQGTRNSDPEHIVLQSQTGSLSLRGYSREVNLVLGSATGQPIDVEVIVNGEKTQTLSVTTHTLYPLYKTSQYTPYVVELRVSQPGLEAYAYTFG